MKLNDFLSKNKVEISDFSLELCRRGIKIMSQSLDHLHDDNHVFRIIGDLNRFLRENRQISKERINFDLLLLAICWHDVWTSRQFPKGKLWVILRGVFDGWGSMLIFRKKVKKIGVNGKSAKKLVKKVKSSIRKHASFPIRSFLPIRITELKILKDLDKLDEWSVARIRHVEEQHLTGRFKINRKLLRLAKFYFERIMPRISGERKFYFPWSKEEFRKRKVDYLKEAERLTKKYGHLLSE